MNYELFREHRIGYTGTKKITVLRKNNVILCRNPTDKVFLSFASSATHIPPTINSHLHFRFKTDFLKKLFSTFYVRYFTTERPARS